MNRRDLFKAAAGLAGAAVLPAVQAGDKPDQPSYVIVPELDRRDFRDASPSKRCLPIKLRKVIREPSTGFAVIKDRGGELLVRWSGKSFIWNVEF